MVFFTMSNANGQLVSGKVTFRVTRFIVGGGYNKQTGEFICPVAGLYHFHFSFMQNSRSTTSCQMLHNGLSIGRAETFSDGTWVTASASVYVQMKIRDVFTVGQCHNWQIPININGEEIMFGGSLIHL